MQIANLIIDVYKRQAFTPLLTYVSSCPTYLFSQLWFPTVQDVLQADWQDV